MANLKITLVKSTIGCPQNQKDSWFKKAPHDRGKTRQ